MHYSILSVSRGLLFCAAAVFAQFPCYAAGSRSGGIESETQEPLHDQMLQAVTTRLGFKDVISLGGFSIGLQPAATAQPPAIPGPGRGILPGDSCNNYVVPPQISVPESVSHFGGSAVSYTSDLKYINGGVGFSLCKASGGIPDPATFAIGGTISAQQVGTVEIYTDRQSVIDTKLNVNINFMQNTVSTLVGILPEIIRNPASVLTTQVPLFWMSGSITNQVTHSDEIGVKIPNDTLMLTITQAQYSTSGATLLQLLAGVANTISTLPTAAATGDLNTLASVTWVTALLENIDIVGNYSATVKVPGSNKPLPVSGPFSVSTDSTSATITLGLYDGINRQLMFKVPVFRLLGLGLSNPTPLF